MYCAQIRLEREVQAHFTRKGKFEINVDLGQLNESWGERNIEQ